MKNPETLLARLEKMSSIVLAVLQEKKNNRRRKEKKMKGMCVYTVMLILFGDEYENHRQ